MTQHLQIKIVYFLSFKHAYVLTCIHASKTCVYTLYKIGVKNARSLMGCHAGDIESYDVYNTFFNSVIKDYHNFDVVYVDDCSTDNTLALASGILESSKKKFSIVSNKTNKKALYNLYNNISSAKDNSIIVTLDGDDFLPNNGVLKYLNQFYNDQECWMTVGSYMQNDNYQVVCPEVSESYWNQNIRKVPWSFSHLRTLLRFVKSL